MTKIPLDQYQKASRLAEIAGGEIKKLVQAALGSLNDPNLVRAHFDAYRIKSRRSIERKAKLNKWKAPDALKRASDLVGIRIVCNNLQDVERAADLIQRYLTNTGIRISKQDYVKSPEKGGYRAIHLNLRVPIRLISEELEVGCEVQIRSLLQDAWARLSHADVYGTSVQVPKQLLGKMETLAESLANADSEADAIRNDLASPRKGSKPKRGARLDKSSTAFLYRRAFDQEASSYLVDTVLAEFGDYDIRADALEQALRDKKLIGRLKSAYQSQMPYDPGPERLFVWVIESLVKGPGSSRNRARHEGRLEWEEIDSIYRREASSSLPNTIDDLMAELDDWGEEPEFGEWATALGVNSECAICRTGIIRPDSLAEALVQHYGLKDERADQVYELVEQAVENSGVEIGDWDHPSLCSYHGNVVAKED